MRYALLFALLLNFSPASAQNKREYEASDIPTVTFCDLVNNPAIFDGRLVKFRTTYLSNSKVAAFVDQSCGDRDKRTWAEFDGQSIKSSATPELFEKVLEQILCGKCVEENKWRETEMLVTGIFDANDTGHGRLGTYRFNVMVKSVLDLGDTVKSETTRFNFGDK